MLHLNFDQQDSAFINHLLTSS